MCMQVSEQACCLSGFEQSLLGFRDASHEGVNPCWVVLICFFYMFLFCTLYLLLSIFFFLHFVLFFLLQCWLSANSIISQHWRLSQAVVQGKPLDISVGLTWKTCTVSNLLPELLRSKTIKIRRRQGFRVPTNPELQTVWGYRRKEDYEVLSLLSMDLSA